MNLSKSEKMMEKAKSFLPAGVNSPVRAFRAVGGTPPFIVKGKGSKIWDLDDNQYIDFVGSWGPLILGHNYEPVLKAVSDTMQYGLSFGAPTALEVEMAEKIISIVPNIDMVRMVNSGTEAVMSAIRLARGATGKAKIIKFAGCYHGHSDSMLVNAGSGALTQGEPDSAGVTKGAAEDTLTAEYNDLDSVRKLFDLNTNEIAAVIVEPVAANMGVVPPADGFLEGLRKLCDENNALLIFDEVITGFRLALGGAQEFFGVRADIVTFGKIIGGGMPVGAYGASKELMQNIAPLGSVYQAGTLSGNPVAMAAGLKQLEILEQNPQYYTEINEKAKFIANNLRESAKKHDIAMNVNQCGGLVCPYFTSENITSFSDTQKSNLEQFKCYFHGMLEHGIYIAPSQFEAMFINVSHSKDDINALCSAADEVLRTL